jgi:hypothetical protein
MRQPACLASETGGFAVPTMYKSARLCTKHQQSINDMPLGCAFAQSFIAKTTLIGILKYLV